MGAGGQVRLDAGRTLEALRRRRGRRHVPREERANVIHQHPHLHLRGSPLEQVRDFDGVIVVVKYKHLRVHAAGRPFHGLDQRREKLLPVNQQFDFPLVTPRGHEPVEVLFPRRQVHARSGGQGRGRAGGAFRAGGNGGGARNAQMPEAACQQGAGILDGGDQQAANEQGIQGPHREGGRQFLRLRVPWISQEDDQPLPQIHKNKAGAFPCHEQELPLALVQVERAGLQQTDGEAREIRVIVSLVHHNLRGFVFQFHLADFARLVPENDQLLILGQQQHTVARRGGGQAGKNSLHQLLPLLRVPYGDLVVPIDCGPARGGSFRLESQHGEPLLIIGGAGFDPRPIGVGISILAAERDADFQVRVRAIRHQVGEAGRLYLLQVTDAGAGRGAPGKQRQQQPSATVSETAERKKAEESRQVGIFPCAAVRPFVPCCHAKNYFAGFAPLTLMRME